MLKSVYQIDLLQLKWPNDIYHKGKKLGGVLIETFVNNGKINCIIGIGLNLLGSDDIEPYINNSCTDLNKITFKELSLNELSAYLINSLYKGLKIFESKGFPAFADKWHELDMLFNKEIKVKTNNGIIIGHAVGASEQGLKVCLSDGGATELFDGEISLIK